VRAQQAVSGVDSVSLCLRGSLLRVLWGAVVACSAVLAQDPPKPDARKLVERITPADPAAAFDAIGRLADLPAADVEAAAAALPEDAAFYRNALLAELKVVAKLGDRYPREARVSVAAKDRMPRDILADILDKSKETVDSGWAFQGPGQPPISLQLDDVPFLAALKAFCKEASVRLQSQVGSLMLYRGGGDLGPTFQFRNYLLVVTSVVRTRRVVFGAGEKRTLLISATLMCDARSGTIGVARLESAEAVDDKGRRFESAPEDREEAPADDLPEAAPNAQLPLTLSIPLKPPEKGVDKIARLRGSFSALLPSATSRFTFSEKLEKGTKQSDDHFEVEIERAATVNRQTTAVLRVKPKGDMRAFLKLPVQILAKTKDGPLRPCWTSGRVAKTEVEYTAQRYATGEEQMQGRANEIESVTLLVHRACDERVVWFELRDIPVE